MAGEAKSNAFMLATATVMIGEQANLYDLNPTDHSIGLVKNFTISSVPVFTDLTQGATNEIVYSVMRGNPVTATMEVYEYTSKNLSYGLGLDGSALSAVTISDTLHTAITGDGSTTTTVVIDALTDTHANYPAGGYVLLQDDAISDLVFVAKTVGAATYSSGTHTVTMTLARAVPTGMVFSVSTNVSPANRISVGSTAAPPFLAAKIVGVLPEKNTPITVLIPKIRVVKGFSVAFNSSAFGNMAFEFKPLDLVPTDTFYADFVGQGPVALFGKM